MVWASSPFLLKTWSALNWKGTPSFLTFSDPSKIERATAFRRDSSSTHFALLLVIRLIIPASVHLYTDNLREMGAHESCAPMRVLALPGGTWQTQSLVPPSTQMGGSTQFFKRFSGAKGIKERKVVINRFSLSPLGMTDSMCAIRPRQHNSFNQNKRRI